MIAETEAERDATDCTVVSCGKCGLVQMLTITSRVDACGNELVAMIAHGSHVSHVPVREARGLAWCECLR